MGVVCAEGGRIIHGNPAGRAGLENRKPFLENPLTIYIIVAGRMNFVGIPQGLRASFLRGIRLKKPHKIDIICRAIVSAFFAVGLVVLMRSMIDQMESKGTAHTSSTSISLPCQYGDCGAECAKQVKALLIDRYRSRNAAPFFHAWGRKPRPVWMSSMVCLSKR